MVKSPIFKMGLLSVEDLENISAALLGDDSAMDNIPFFSPADAEAWRIYDYRNDVSLLELRRRKSLLVN